MRRCLFYVHILHTSPVAYFSSFEYETLKKISVSKGQVHESVIHVQDKGSVLTWDFDVLHHDIVFTVFRLNAQLKVQASHAISATNLTVKHPGTTPAVGSTQTGKTTF